MSDTLVNTSRFFGISDAARYTGLSTQTIRRWINDGKLTAHRPGARKTLISRQELDALVLGSAGGSR
jgi:excisionase family DNA binding protein